MLSGQSCRPSVGAAVPQQVPDTAELRLVAPRDKEQVAQSVKVDSPVADWILARQRCSDSLGVTADRTRRLTIQFAISNSRVCHRPDTVEEAAAAVTTGGPVEGVGGAASPFFGQRVCIIWISSGPNQRLRGVQ